MERDNSVNGFKSLHQHITIYLLLHQTFTRTRDRVYPAKRQGQTHT